MSTPTRPRWTAFVGNMANYIDAAALISWSTVLVIYQRTRSFTPAEIGFGNGTLTGAVAIGALVGGWLADRLGRRPIFIATMALILLGTLGMIFADTLPLVLIATALAGLGIGADLPVATSTIAEAAPSSASRGRFVGLTGLFWLVGALIAGVGGGVVGNLGEVGALILLAHIGVATAFTLIARLTISESADWLAARAERRSGTRTSRAARASIRDLVRAPHRVPFLGLLGFVIFGVAPGLAILGHYGVYMLVNYGGGTVSSASLVSLIGLPLGIAGSLLFVKAAGGTRRFRYFTIAVIVLVVATLIPAVFGLNFATYAAYTAIGAICAPFCGDAISRIWTQQSFPTLIRTTAQGTVLAVNRFAVAVITTITPLLLNVGVGFVFGMIAAATAVSGVIAWSVFRSRDQESEFRDDVVEFVEPAPRKAAV